MIKVGLVEFFKELRSCCVKGRVKDRTVFVVCQYERCCQSAQTYSKVTGRILSIEWIKI